MLLRRLAEDYVELENAAFREKTEAEIKRDNFKAEQPARGRQAAGDRQLAQDDAWSARARPPSTTTPCSSPTTRAARRPTFPQNPPPAYPHLDEVYYYLAYEYEQSGDTANARRVYLDLITKTPNSKYIPNAYLAFGELFFNEAMGDPTKWEPCQAGVP